MAIPRTFAPILEGFYELVEDLGKRDDVASAVIRWCDSGGDIRLLGSGDRDGRIVLLVALHDLYAEEAHLDCLPLWPTVEDGTQREVAATAGNWNFLKRIFENEVRYREADVRIAVKKVAAEWQAPELSEAELFAALRAACAELDTAIDERLAEVKDRIDAGDSNRFIGPAKDFLDLLQKIPGADVELRRRAAFIREACGPSTEFATTRSRIQEVDIPIPPANAAATISLSNLRSLPANPEHLGIVLQLQDSAERLLNWSDQIEQVKANEQTLKSFCKVCKEIRGRSAGLECDGCYWLRLVLDDSPGILTTAFISHNLQSVKKASAAMVEWARAELEAIADRAAEEFFADRSPGSDDPQPFRGATLTREYGTDLHWFAGWGECISAALDSGKIGKNDWMVFRPSSLARAAMMRFSMRYPVLLGQVEDALRWTEKAFEEMGDGANKAAIAILAEAMQSLAGRIRVAAQEIANHEGTETPATWVARPFAKRKTEVKGAGAVPGHLLPQIFAPIPIQTYSPTAEEISLVRYLGLNPRSPNWDRIRALLIGCGVAVSDDLTAEEALAILGAKSPIEASVDNLTAYFGAIAVTEEGWYREEIATSEEAGGRWCVGSSRWNDQQDSLQRLGEQFGIRRDDPRVFSIRGYKRERELLTQAFTSECEQHGWTVAPSKDDPDHHAYWSIRLRYERRLANLNSRHFGRLFHDVAATPTAITSPRLLWAYIHQEALVMLSICSNPKVNLPRRLNSNGNLDVEVEMVYDCMRNLKINGAPSVPYAGLSIDDAIRKLQEISDHLEAAELESSRCVLCRQLKPLEDADRAVCISCARMDGKLGEIDVAIRTGQDLGRFADWGRIAHWAGKLFDMNSATAAAIFDRVRNWLLAEYEDSQEELAGPWPSGGVDSPSAWVLRVPLTKVVELLKSELAECRDKGDEIKHPENAAEPRVSATKAKKSTSRGEARAKCASALTEWHKYAKDGCLNFTPIASNELARLAGVADSSANSFFNHWFGLPKNDKKDGWKNYKIACRKDGHLIISLKRINGELPTPGEMLYGRKPPTEGRDDD